MRLPSCQPSSPLVLSSLPLKARPLSCTQIERYGLYGDFQVSADGKRWTQRLTLQLQVTALPDDVGLRRLRRGVASLPFPGSTDVRVLKIWLPEVLLGLGAAMAKAKDLSLDSRLNLSESSNQDSRLNCSRLNSLMTHDTPQDSRKHNPQRTQIL